MPSPPHDYGIYGWRATGQKRVICGWFGMSAEQLWEHEDGSSKWRRYYGQISLNNIRPASEENAA